MNELQGLMSNITTMQRRIITVIMAAIVAFVGIFFGLVNIAKDFQDLLNYFAPKDMQDMLKDGSMSVVDLFRLALDQGETESVIVCAVMILGFSGGLGLVILAVVIGNKYIPLALIPISALNLVYSVVYLFIVNEDGDFMTFSMTRIFILLLSTVTAGFWYIACESPEVEGTPESQQKAKEELGKVMNNVMAKADEVKKANSCPHCNKLLTPKSQFCNGCGQPVPQAKAACTGCQAPLATGAQFCPKCGTPRQQ